MRLLLLPILSLCLCACKPSFEAPTLKLDAARVHDIEFDAAYIEVTVTVLNPNPFPIAANTIRYTASLNGRAAARGKVDDVVIVGANNTAKVRTMIEMRYSEIGDAWQFANKQTRWPWLVEGDVGVDVKGVRVTLPFTKKGMMEQPRWPQVVIRQAVLENANLLGATARVIVDVHNRNVFTLPASVVEMDLFLSGTKIGSGQAELGEISRQRRREAELVTSLTYLEAGQGVVAAARTGKVMGELRGQISFAGKKTDFTVPVTLFVAKKKQK